MSKRLLYIVIVGGGVITIVALFFSLKNRQPSSPSAGAPGSSLASYLYDYSDPRVLVGWSQNVFAAKVLKQISSVPRSDLSYSQYDVEVIYNVKGNLSGSVVIDFPTFEGETIMQGATYLFATRHVGTPWYVVGSHPASKALVTKDAGLSREQLVNLIRKHERTYELLNAYPNEIVLEAYVRENAATNIFQSLSDEEKRAVYAKFAELIPPRPIPGVLPPPPAPPQDITESTGAACRDGIDNDNDGLVDRNDYDCSRYYREDLPSFCRDGEDNDRDGKIDAADPDCAPYYPQPAPPSPVPPVANPTSTIPTTTSSTTATSTR